MIDARWIYASIQKHIDDNKGTLTFIPDENIIGEDIEQDHITVRFDGPYYRQLSKDYWHVIVGVNIMIVQQRSDIDYHKMYKTIDTVKDIINQHITVTDYDTDTKLLCLQPRTAIDVVHLPRVGDLQRVAVITTMEGYVNG